MSSAGRSEEDYLTVVFRLEEDGAVPIRARVAERLAVSPAAASEAIERLIERGFITDGADRRLHLSDSGRQIALTSLRRHRLAERLLVDVLGLPPERAPGEAARWAHVISDDVEERLVIVLGDPATCPHGRPIPREAEFDRSRRIPDR